MFKYDDLKNQKKNPRFHSSHSFSSEIILFTGIIVRELTGDMQLTSSKIQQTQMLVTAPEKWDVITR